MEVSVCVCGAGTMGRGIAMAIIQSGIPVILYDVDPAMTSGAAAWIHDELERGVVKKRISQTEKNNALGKLRCTQTISDCRAPLIIEAIVERIENKRELFTTLFKINGTNSIYATNTSSLSVTDIALQTDFPEQIAGLHFFNPANRMKLVEVVKTSYTKKETIAFLLEFAAAIDKKAVVCLDAPGFIVNRVARPYYLEAMRLCASGLAISPIDKLAVSAGFKMGPFSLMDLIGLDINYTVSVSLYEALGKPARLQPARMQEELVKKGMLGRKTGSGFYQYQKSPGT